MAHVYTPGLKVASNTKVRKERRLPLKGEVIVTIGTKVTAETMVARTELPGDVNPLNIGGLLGVPPEDIEHYLMKHPGDSLTKGEPIAQTKGLFGFMKTTINSPIDGTFESLSKITGQAILRQPPTLVAINAYIDGIVTEVLENEGVIIDTVGAFIQGIFGIGGETVGILKKAVANPADILTAQNISSADKDKILIAGSYVTCETMKKAVECGCKGIIVGGIGDQELKEFLGYDIGVAITGTEKKGLTLIVTEGFGPMQMAKRTFELLCSYDGRRASINGATQIRAGVLRPEVIIPLSEDEKDIKAVKEIEIKGVDIGTRVRIIREPYFGKLGKVKSLPSELRQIETGTKVRTFEITLDDGTDAVLPRANVEMIEE
ncbi:MAG: hypothetical protein PHX21_00105 [bacterium]|nr:hypothetical protein [bacterium]